MKKILPLIFLLLLFGQAEAAYIERTDCGDLTSPVVTVAPNKVTCKQTTNANGRLAGQIYNWTGTVWEAMGGGTGTFTGDATDVPFVSGAGLGSGDVGAALDELQNEKQPLHANLTDVAGLSPSNGECLQWSGTDIVNGTCGSIGADLTAIEALTGTGIPARTANDTWSLRTFQGSSGNIVITNPAGVAGNPVIDLGSTAVQTDQANTYSTGAQDFGSATSLKVPTSAGAAPATSGFIAYDSTANAYEGAVSGVNVTFAMTTSNVATATALAANGSNSNRLIGEFAVGVDASGNAEADQVAKASAGAPTLGTVGFPAQIFKDTRSFGCGVQGYTYVGSSAGGDFAPIFSEGDGYTTFTDGVDTSSPCGAETIGIRGSGGISTYVYNKTADFTNQPTNDGWEAISSSAGDVAWLRVCGTITGTNLRNLACETIQLTGTSQIASVTTTYADIFTARICTTSACVANSAAVGTVTLREASGNATITTIAPGASKAATQDVILQTITSTLDINGLTQETTINSANDKFPFYDASAGANREGRTTDIISTWEVTFKAVSCDETTGTLLLDTVNSLKPTADCTAGTTETTIIRGVALFPDADGLHSVQDWLELPATWTGAIDARITWRANATANDVAWKLQTACRTTGEVDDVAWNAEQEIVDTALGTANFLNHATQTSVTTTGCAAGEIMRWKLSRDRTDAQDTLAVSPSLFSIKFTGRKKLGT